MKMKSLTFAVFVWVLLWTISATAVPKNKEHARKVGRKGEITLAQPTTVGDKVLQPGTYVVQHRVSGGDHFVRFVELKTVERLSGETRETYTEANKAGEIKCRVEPAPAPIKETTVYTAPDAAGQRITRVAIKGEDVVHVF
jgi:hypothetical protein